MQQAVTRRSSLKRAAADRSKVNLSQEQERLRADILAAASAAEVVNLVHSARLVGMEPDARVLATAFEQVASFGDKSVFRTAPKASEILSTASPSAPFFPQAWQPGGDSSGLSPLFLRLYSALGIPSNSHSMDDSSCVAILSVLLAAEHADASLYAQVEQWLRATRGLANVSEAHLADYAHLLARARGVCQQQGGQVELFTAIAREAESRGPKKFFYWDRRRLCDALEQMGVEVARAFSQPSVVLQERRARLMSRDLHLADLVFEGGNGKGAYL